MYGVSPVFPERRTITRSAVGIGNFSEDNSLSQRGGIEINERFR